MALEAATYISQLSQSNPTSADLFKQGDDHLRLIKEVLKATFPNASFAQAFRDIQAESSSASPSTADSGKMYPITTAGGNVSVSLPAVPLQGNTFEFYKSDFSSNVLTIDGNGNTINGLTSVKLFKPFQKIKVYYSTAISAWVAETDSAIETGTFIDNSAASLQNAIIADGTKTLGSTSSGADYLGNRYRQLYVHLYVNYPDSICPVNGGRSGSNQAAAETDFAANKRITMPALNGYMRITADNQGAGTGSRVTAANAPGVVGGSETSVILRTNLENTTVNVAVVLNDPGHIHNVSIYYPGGGGANNGSGNSFQSRPTDSATTGITVTSASFNLNGNVVATPFNKMPPYFTTRTHMAL